MPEAGWLKAIQVASWLVEARKDRLEEVAQGYKVQCDR